MKSIRLCFGVFVSLMACVKTGDFENPEQDCPLSLEANTTFAQVKSLYRDEIMQIQEDWVIEGYVVSSDKMGNFFSVLYFQDQSANATEGFQIEIDLRDSHLFYPIGSKILIKLKGLYLGKSKDVFTLGGTFAGFGTTSVGRLPALKVAAHVIVSCDELTQITPRSVVISELDSGLTNTLVTLGDVEVVDQELDSAFAISKKETKRTLTNCLDDKLTLLNSGFSDFQATPLPIGNGSITGVLLRENNTYFLAIRNLNDIDFSNPRCEDVVTEFTSNQILISELADPNNNSKARFVELYNASEEALDLNAWKLNRYTNANTEISSTIDLSGFIIDGKSTFVISPNAKEFEQAYGFPPDLEVGTNSPADSNGDDNLQLVDPFGTVIDSFGVVGEDGSGTNHEFEDGRAVRKSQILIANATYTFSEWTIFNDSGDAGTINQPKNAPEDFSPAIKD